MVPGQSWPGGDEKKNFETQVETLCFGATSRILEEKWKRRKAHHDSQGKEEDALEAATYV